MPAEASGGDGPIRQEAGQGQAMGVFRREAGSVADARAWLSDFLQQNDVPEALHGDAVLVISELVTNALRHGLGDIVARTSFTDGGVLHLSVTDSARELPDLQPVDPSRVGGVGLHIVERLSSGWGVAPFPGGKTVWATMAAPSRSRGGAR
jgi:anti-sigma regulatory factor (Ser/Thr protein kinase)